MLLEVLSAGEALADCELALSELGHLPLNSLRGTG